MVAALILALAAASLPATQPAPAMTAVIETIDLSTPVISPDGKTVAYRQGQASLETNHYALGWWVAPLDGSARPVKVGDGGTAIWKAEGVPLVEPPVWSSDSARLYYRALKDGQVQVWRSRADGQGGEQVTHDDADVDRFVLEPQGRLAYVVRAARAEILDAERSLYDGGVRIDATIDPSQALFGAVEINGRMAPERLSGRWFQRDSLLGETPDRVRTVDLATLSLVTEAADKAPERPAPPNVFAPQQVFSKSASPAHGQARLVWRSGRFALEVERPDGTVVTCRSGPCNAKSLGWAAWRPGRDEVVFSARDEARRSVLAIWRVDGAVRIVTRDPGALDAGAFGQPCAVTQTQAVCVHAAALAPPRLERIDLATGERAVLAEPNGPPIQDPSVAAERLVWRDAKGRMFSGELVRPTVAGRAPLFINYYNCDGYLRGGVGDEWPVMAFARAGIAALCINATRDDQGEFDAVEDYEIALGGIRAAIDLLDQRGVADPRRVGMGGLSFGTEVTTWVARKSKLLAAASIASVQIEPAYYWLNGVAGRDVHDGLRRAWKLGAPDETPDRWKLVSPALSVQEITTPLLMQMPEQEYRPSIELFARLSNSATPVELHVFAQERHVLAQPRHRLAAYQRNLDWFRFWLQGYVDPSPLKADQYRRWTAMSQRGEAR